MKRIVFVILIYSLLNTVFAQNISNYRKGILQFEEELIQKLTNNEPGTSVAITYDDKIVFEKYYGMANLERGIKLNSKHHLGVASMSKQFTGMAILSLAHEGKLKLDDNILKYFPNLPIGDRIINIKQLLSHTSGLPELTQNRTFMNQIEKPHTVEQIFEMGFAGEYRSKVGEKFIYCNTGFTICVALVEKLSNMSFSEYMSTMIFAPLNMKDSYICDYNRDAITAVPRYVQDSLTYNRAINMHFSNLIGGGSMVSNVQDMAKWGMALVSGKNLPANYKKIWESVLLNSGESTGYGLGLGVNHVNGKEFYYHPGMGSGMNSIFLIFPEEKISITVIRNMSKPKVSSKEIALTAAQFLFPEEE